ncbi:hypothetical protein [Phormidesmis priestleyi]|nr:hypothetical protein [Phormidesmis priestleyi]
MVLRGVSWCLVPILYRAQPSIATSTNSTSSIAPSKNRTHNETGHAI